MEKALDLAKKGWPDVVPNPMVGCVIVQNDRIVSFGYHQEFGGPHAEVNAIRSMPPGISCGDCVLYVTLEPCSHHGKTPPCAELIVKSGFKKVVVACADPNPAVLGRGLKLLREAGVDVVVGILENEARYLNRRFITFFEKKRPYIILKWALTADGFVSRIPVPEKRADNLITRLPAHEFVHRLRAQTMAIIAGKNTVLHDNPHLTTRLVKGKNPVRIVIDGKLEIPRSHHVFNPEAPTIVFNYVRDAVENNITLIRLEQGNLVRQLLSKLHDLNIQTLLVEGGSTLLSDFISMDLWDEALVFQNPDLDFGAGLRGPEFPLKNVFRLIGEDKLYHHWNPDSITGGNEQEIF
jgi:diaminohydroxyphosphoribosylaminopyrimidine deaminase / 5-amino-6-(5-phosphoribosylamino)uracil reductase